MPLFSLLSVLVMAKPASETTFTATLYIGLLTEMADPMGFQALPVPVPRGCTMPQLFPLLEPPLKRKILALLPGLKCCACNRPHVHHNYVLLSHPDSDKEINAYVGMVWVLPECAEPACIRKISELRRFLPLRFRRALMRAGALPKDSEIVTASKINLRQCGNCQRRQREDEARFLVCSRCRELHYCSAACMLEAWERNHRHQCLGREVPRASELIKADWATALVETTLFGNHKEPPLKHQLVRVEDVPVEKAQLRECPDKEMGSRFPLLITWLHFEAGTQTNNVIEAAMNDPNGVEPTCYACSKLLRNVGGSWSQASALIKDAEQDGLVVRFAIAYTCTRQTCRTIADAGLQSYLLAGHTGTRVAGYEDCAHCRQWPMMEKPFPRCAGCGERSYCSVACQKADWPRHKEYCRARSKEKAADTTQ